MKRIFRSGRVRTIVILIVLAFLASIQPAMAAYSSYEHNQLLNSSSYEAKYGHWQTIDLPKEWRINAVHAALLDTGKILIIAGSGNDADAFAAGTFKSLLYDPTTGHAKVLKTPTDLFCGGHAFLPDGRLIIAGGTQRYEKLAGDITNAGGIMTVKNEDPNGTSKLLVSGTVFIGPNGQKYKSDADVLIQPATKVDHGHGDVKITASSTTVWVDAVQAGTAGVVTPPQQVQYKIEGLQGNDTHNIYGMAGAMTLDKQDFQGSADTYIFDPKTESYQRMSDMDYKRWYPTLVGLANGDVLASSGLDGNGQILDGQTEIWSASQNVWVQRPDLTQYFPTYPTLMQTAKPDVLFYTGSNAGYGSATQGRTPAFWNLATNKLTTVPGIRNPDLLETSGSAWVGPVQNQTVMVVGGGAVGECNNQPDCNKVFQSGLSTGRIDTINLNDPSPHWTPGPSLPQGTRYPGLVTLPDDTTLISGGSSDYRGKHNSDNHTARIYHPDTGTLSVAADPAVGRDYHSESLLMPDGTVITMGGNPLFSDKKDTVTAPFEQRLEIYRPPYLYTRNGPAERPTVTSVPTSAKLGETMTVTTPNAADIAKARLIRPSAVTHVTNVEQRSVELTINRVDGAVQLGVPGSSAIVPPGYYMLFLVNTQGVPSIAQWVDVT